MGMDEQWKMRILCSDESCIGTIGADGKCRECGLAFEGELPDGFNDAQGNAGSTSMAEPVEDDHEIALDETDDAGETDDGETEDSDTDPDDEWARRLLCIDESCIGVVDDTTGCCKDCGKPYPKS